VESEEREGSLRGKDIWLGREIFEQTTRSVELVFARKLGNCERLEVWREREFYAAARQEWWTAWQRYFFRHGLGPVLSFRADSVSGRGDLEPMKGILLLCLRRSDDHAETLRNMAEVVRVAARNGDVEFFKSMSAALESGGVEEKIEGFLLGYHILGYWFSGALWLMSDKAGWAALCAYSGKAIERDAYRQACRRLKLRGYKGRVGKAPVLGYDKVSGTYRYAE